MWFPSSICIMKWIVIFYLSFSYIVSQFWFYSITYWPIIIIILTHIIFIIIFIIMISGI